MKIFLIRHGQTQWNLQKRMQGSGDSPLTEKGLEQASAIGKFLSNKNISYRDFEFLVSPLNRAQHTAKIICQNLGIDFHLIKTENDLREKSFGIWEGKLEEEIIKNYPKEYKLIMEGSLELAPPQGESEISLIERVKNFQNHLSQDKNYVLITHFYFSRSFQLSYLNKSLNSINSFTHLQNSIYLLENNLINHFKILD